MSHKSHTAFRVYRRNLGSPSSPSAPAKIGNASFVTAAAAASLILTIDAKKPSAWLATSKSLPIGKSLDDAPCVIPEEGFPC
jgi:hypothetical protein